jgi:dTDP-4-dehydrorhamnose reductase
MSGFLGSEVTRQASARGWIVTGSHHRRPIVVAGVTSEPLDVRDPKAVAELFERARPDAVVHTAYVKAVPAAEATIVEGTAHVVAAARRHGVRLVHMSTDVVFGGRTAPYATDDRRSRRRLHRGRRPTGRRGGRARRHRAHLLYSIAAVSRAVVTDAGPTRASPTSSLPDSSKTWLAGWRPTTRPHVRINAAEVVSRYEFACLIAAHHGMAADAVTAGTGSTHTARRPRRVALIPSMFGCRDASEVLRPRSS